MKILIQKLIVPVSFILLSLLSLPVQASAVIGNYIESSSEFNLTLIGNSFDNSQNYNFNQGTFWDINIDVFEETHFDFEILSLSGTARHVIAPHGEAPGLAYHFNFDVDTRQYSDGFHVLHEPIVAFPHENHQDQFDALFTFEKDTNWIYEEFESYRLELNGLHIDTGEVPLPAPLWLLISGIAVMFGINKKSSRHLLQ